MKILKLLSAGFKSKRLITTIYLIQFVLAVTIGLQVYQVLNASIGHSVSLEGLKLGNAHMVVNDLLNVHGASLSPLLGQVRWLVIVYLLIAAFVHSGIWYSLITKTDQTSFWTGGAIYFGRSLIIGLVIMVLFLLMSAILWLPYFSKIQFWMEHLSSEAPILWGGIGLFVLWCILSVFFFVASSYSKIYLIRDGKSVFSSIKNGILRSVRKTFSLFPFLFIIFIILVGLYFGLSLVDDWPLFSTSAGIFILFLLQQCIIWVKIGLRISSYDYLLNRS